MVDRTPDAYVQQLREIFLSCDSSGAGRLNHSGLQQLCRRLNLESYISNRIIDSLHLSSSSNQYVNFDQFKEAFISALTEDEKDDDGEVRDVLKAVNSQHAGDKTENAIDLSDEEKHLQEIFKELGVGANGFLTKEELLRVCQYLNMDHMTDEELEQLFTKLDADGDGLVRFAELLHGLFEIGETGHPEPLQSTMTPKRMLSLPSNSSYKRPTKAHRFSQPTLCGWEGVLAFLDKDGTGYASYETIIQLWGSFGITEGRLVLELIHFDEKKPIRLHDLSLALLEEIHSIEADNNVLYKAALSTIEHALDHLHSVVEDLKLERTKLNSELTEIRNRNESIVKDFEDAYNSSEVEKIQKQRTDAETKCEEIRGRLNQESENSALLQNQVYGLRQEISLLKRQLTETKKEKDTLTDEFFQMSDRCSGLEDDLEKNKEELKLLAELKQQIKEQERSNTKLIPNASDDDQQTHVTLIENLRLENRKLKDELDEQMTTVDELRKQLRIAHEMAASATAAAASKTSLNKNENWMQMASRDSVISQGGKGDPWTDARYETELQNLMRGMSNERRDIEGTFQIEIAELEQRHTDEIKVLKEEFEKEKSSMVAQHRRHLADALAEQERDLLTEFVKESTGNLISDAGDTNELEKKLQEAEAVARSNGDYIRELEKRLKEMEEIQKRKETKELEESNEATAKFQEEKLQMLKRFEEEIAAANDDYKRDLQRNHENLEKTIVSEKKEMETLFSSDRKRFMEKIQLLEREMLNKEAEIELLNKKFQQELNKKEEEKDEIKKEAERVLFTKEEEKEQLMKEAKIELKKKNEENEKLRRDLEDSKEGFEKEFVTMGARKLKDEVKASEDHSLRPTENAGSDILLKMQIDELLRNNVRLKDEMEKTIAGEKEKMETSLSFERKRFMENIQLLERQMHNKDAEIELLKKKYEQELHKKEEEKDQIRKDAEAALNNKEVEKEELKKEADNELKIKFLESKVLNKEAEMELIKKKFEQELYKKEEEKDQIKKDAEKALYNTEEEKERFKKEAETELKKINEENNQLRRDLERKASKEGFEKEFVKTETRKLKDEIKSSEDPPLQHSKNAGSDILLKMQIDELCRNNVRLKDELEKRCEEVLKLRQKLQLNQKNSIAENQGHVNNNRLLAERDMLRKQLQLTVQQLSEATSALSVTSQQLNQEKDSWQVKSSQMVEKGKYEDLVVKLRHSEARAHRVQHDLEFKTAETTKLLTLSSTVNKQKQDQLKSENERLENQIHKQKLLINDQLDKISKQADELLKGDVLIRDMYIENAHLLKCLQRTEGSRQESDGKVHVLEEKCLALGQILHKIGATAIR